MKINQLFRSLLRDRLNTSVVIISLAVGMAAFNLIIMFISRELQTDSFHEGRDQIYALKCEDPWVPGKHLYLTKFGSAEYMKANFPQVEDFCRITNSGSQKIVINNVTYFDQPPILRASSNFFSFFSYKLVTNNPETALESTNNIVISEELAKKYFGTENPLGKVIEIVNQNSTEKMVVSGIFEKPVYNSQLIFDMVRLAKESDSRCYLRLSKQSKKDEMEKLFLERKEIIPIVNTGTPGSYFLEPFRKAYFDTTRGSSVEISRNFTDIWIALIIGLLILGIAAFNYLGILSNKFSLKIREYKIRHINGGSRFGIILSFMLENSILIFFSFLLSLYLMFELIPFFNELTGSIISLKAFIQPEQVSLLMAVIAFIWTITLLFVLYLIYGEANSDFLKIEDTRHIKSAQIPVLNIFQISGSIALIICSIVIIRQMNYITNKPIGLDKTVIEVKLPGQYADKALVFREELLKNNSINSISVVGASPVLEHFLVSLTYTQDGTEKQYSPAGFTGDENYIKTLGIQVIEGDDFAISQSDNAKKCIINKSFVRLFPGQDLIGKGMPGMEDMIITGIVNDFHYSDLKELVEPAFIAFSKNGSHLLVKPSENQTVEAARAISAIWKELIPEFPVDTESIGDRYEWFHRENSNYLKLIISCSVISIFLSMIGLFSISFQRTSSRTKEIGIRKINGASIAEILIMLNKDLARWILLAVLIAVPVSWYAMNKWLQNYAYKTEITWWVFLIAVSITLFIALLTVSWHSWRTSTRNPVEALRYE